MAPSYVLDYLAAHEVAHLVHMNHSPAFWKILGKLSAHVERAEAWLKIEWRGAAAFRALQGLIFNAFLRSKAFYVRTKVR